MHRSARICLATAFATASAPALAHPGHSSIASSLAELVHLLVSPDHLFGTIVVSVVLLGLAAAGARRLARKERRDDPR